MKTVLLFVVVGVLSVLVGFNYYREPPCQCEVTVHQKKRKSVATYVVSLVRDSMRHKPLILAAVVINKVIVPTDNQGRAYSNVMAGKHTLVAKAFTYYFCTQKVVAREGDSIVCVFNLRRSREVHGPDVYIRNKGLLRRLFPGK